jgi:superfamily I DNA/RNA helicase
VTTQVVISDLFQKSCDQLDGSLKARVLDFIMKLQRDPAATGLDLKMPAGVRDRRVRTARVNDNFRAVLFELPEGFVLAAVRPHDAAYAYAARLQIGVNAATGAAEILDVAAASTAAASAAGSAVSARPGSKPVLGNVSAADLGRFGVLPEIAVNLIQITDEDLLLTAADALPRAQGEAVLDLAAGRSPEQVWADFAWADATTEADTSDVAGALGRALSRLSFTSLEHDADLQAALEGPFERWRVFLHPMQRVLAYRDYNGPVRVTGGPGTGKTVTALHRAAHLASQGQRVLFATYSRTLRDNIADSLVKLAGRSVLDQVDVQTVDSVAYQVLLGADDDPAKMRTARVLSDTSQTALDYWQEAAVGSAKPWHPGFLAAEWTQIVLAKDIRDRQAYLTVSRAGRGQRLNRIDRAELWEIFKKFELLLDREGCLTFTQIAAHAAAVPARIRYDHAVVDEAQDLNPAHWKLLRNVASQLFLVGDAHQRIYSARFNLSQLGIETRGRSRRLTVNYRTSREILRCCLGIVSGTSFDDLDEGTDTLQGYRSEFSGPAPTLRGYPSHAEELASLVWTVKEWQAEGIAPRDMCVVARTNPQREDAARALHSAGFTTLALGPTTSPQDEDPGLRVMTMHRAKGLEFQAIAVVGADDRTIPPGWLIPDDDVDARQFLQQERCLLYVACSRARDRLAVSWTGEPSRFLAQLTKEAPQEDHDS